MVIARPTAETATQRAAEFQNRPKYRLAEESLSTLFSTWPANKDLSLIHLKVVALNSMYSTQIYDTYSVSQHIYALDIDAALSTGDLQLVERIARMPIGDSTRFNLSFASKYCSWHESDRFAIFDSYVEEALWYFQRTYEFASFRRKDLRVYGTFIEILEAFSNVFDLNRLSKKELDQYLWIEGESLRVA